MSLSLLDQFGPSTVILPYLPTLLTRHIVMSSLSQGTRRQWSRNKSLYEQEPSIWNPKELTITSVPAMKTFKSGLAKLVIVPDDYDLENPILPMLKSLSLRKEDIEGVFCGSSFTHFETSSMV